VANFFSEYGLFLLKTITLVVGFLSCIVVSVAVASKSRRQEQKGELAIESLNASYDELREIMNESIMDDAALKQQKKLKKEQEKQDKQAKKAKKKIEETTEAEKIPTRKRLFVIDFNGDMKASRCASLAQEITAILSVAEVSDEILVRLESPGGLVHAYGLAASQLERIVKKNIPLTVAVDKVAASGGYMMACIATRIIAAPFAILGSIGVVAQIPNLHRLLKKHDVDVEILTAGEYKRTLTIFGENTEKGKQKFMEELEQTHVLFKEFVGARRPQVDIAKVATGEHWYAVQAQAFHLVDEIMTSDEYLTTQSAEADIYTVRYDVKKTLKDKLIGGATQLFERLNWVIPG